MATMTISLPDDISGYVQEGVAAGDFQNGSDYVRALIRQDHEQLTRFPELIREGLASPVAGPADDAYFEGLRGRIRRSAAER